jgi:hypothetical protein
MLCLDLQFFKLMANLRDRLTKDAEKKPHLKLGYSASSTTFHS